MRFVLQVNDTIEELRGTVSNELSVLPVLNKKGIETTLARVQLLQNSVTALKAFNMRLFSQYQRMLQTGKPINASADGHALAQVLERLNKSKLVETFKQEAEALGAQLANERDDIPTDS